MRAATADLTATTGPPRCDRHALSDTDLYRRGMETLLASWEQYAQAATGAAVQRSAGVATAVFPNEPERSVYRRCAPSSSAAGTRWMR